MSQAPHFVITIGRRAPGIRLSLCGHWGNQSHLSVEAAEAEARRLGGPDAVIERRASR